MTKTDLITTMHLSCPSISLAGNKISAVPHLSVWYSYHCVQIISWYTTSSRLLSVVVSSIASSSTEMWSQQLNCSYIAVCNQSINHVDLFSWCHMSLNVNQRCHWSLSLAWCVSAVKMICVSLLVHGCEALVSCWCHVKPFEAFHSSVCSRFSIFAGTQLNHGYVWNKIILK